MMNDMRILEGDQHMAESLLLRALIRDALVTEGRQAAAEEDLADMPEYASVEDFVDSLEDDGFSHVDLQALARRRHGVPSPSQPQLRALRAELESYGLKLLAREPPKAVRGVTSSVNGRHPFAGSGGGGSGFSSGWGSGGFTSFGGGPGAIGGGYDWKPDDSRNLSMGSKRAARIKESKSMQQASKMAVTQSRAILEPAVRELVNALIAQPELLTTQDAIDALDGHFGKIKPGTIITPNDAEKVFKDFDKAIRMLGYTTEHEHNELAQAWAQSFARTIPELQRIAVATNKRPQNTPTEGETWGRYLFAPSRTDVPMEANVPDEQAAYDAIWKVLFANKPMSRKIAKQLQRLVASGEYSKMLAPTAYDMFYRGMNHVNDADLRHLLGHYPNESGGEENVQSSFVPRGSGSSWSVSKDAARHYATALSTDPLDPEKGSQAGEWSVLMTATSADNSDAFILNPDMLYTIGDFAGGEIQDNELSSEVYGVGPIKLSSVSYWLNRKRTP